MKINYFTIPLITIAVWAMGVFFTQANIKGWYDTLSLPGWTPPGVILSSVWAVNYVTATLAALFMWNKKALVRKWDFAMFMLLVNASLNAVWTYVFFEMHELALSLLVTFLMLLTLMILMMQARTWTVRLLLSPYFFWMFFVLALNYKIWQLNLPV